MKPETARSHSRWPCTISYTPLDLHQSEEGKKKKKRILDVTAMI